MRLHENSVAKSKIPYKHKEPRLLKGLFEVPNSEGLGCSEGSECFSAADPLGQSSSQEAISSPFCDSTLTWAYHTHLALALR